MALNTLQELVTFFKDSGAVKILYKQLVDNDNSKQQIYFGSGFSVLTEIPYGPVKSVKKGKTASFQARMNFSWINTTKEISPAPHTKLILYPKYPEVRLSGFLKNCPGSPNQYMQPKPKELRGEKNKPDGRVLFLGIKSDGHILAFLAGKDSDISKNIILDPPDSTPAGGIFRLIEWKKHGKTSKDILMTKLSEIHSTGWHESCRMDSKGEFMEYTARNGGGYTLEALLGIAPNGIAAPDFMDWELKAFTSGRLTLMTPEPDLGFYKEKGVQAFTLKYGHDKTGYIKYFTGTHKCNERNKTTALELVLSGYDPERKKITDVEGGILLLDTDGQITAGWSFARLIEHWGKKHSNVCYVHYEKDDTKKTVQYRYESPVWFGCGTDFTLFLQAMHDKKIIFDPGSHIKKQANGKTTHKARSQFRIAFKDLPCLYNSWTESVLNLPQTLP